MQFKIFIVCTRWTHRERKVISLDVFRSENEWTSEIWNERFGFGYFDFQFSLDGSWIAILNCLLNLEISWSEILFSKGYRTVRSCIEIRWIEKLIKCEKKCFFFVVRMIENLGPNWFYYYFNFSIICELYFEYSIGPRNWLIDCRNWGNFIWKKEYFCT